MPLKGIAKPDYAVGSRRAQRPVVESTATAQANACLIPGNQRHKSDRADIERRGFRRRLWDSESAGTKGNLRPVRHELQRAADGPRQIHVLAGRPCLLDQSGSRELLLRGDIRQDRRRLPVRNEARQPRGETVRRDVLVRDRQAAPRQAHLLSDLLLRAPHPVPWRDGQWQSVLVYGVSNESDGLGTDPTMASTVVRLGRNVGLPPEAPCYSLAVPRKHFDSMFDSAPHPVNLTDLSSPKNSAPRLTG